MGAAPAAAQDVDPLDTLTHLRRVAGRVLTPADTGMRPIPGAWVTLHRIGRDRAGPVDSMRTGRQGEYAFRYRTTVDDSATWTVSTVYAGIAHFSSSFAEPEVAGEAGEIVVFDTTSAPVELHVRGRHFVVFAARGDEPRRILEVFELENDGVTTALSRGDTTPVWRVPLPASARNVTVDESSLPAGSTRVVRSEVRLHAPLTPGIHQVAVRYELPPSAFPFELRLRDEVDVLEVLVEEPFARVTAEGLEEVESAESEGHRLRRFLARHAHAGLRVRIELPSSARGRRAPAVAFIVGGTAVLMAAALAAALRRPATI